MQDLHVNWNRSVNSLGRFTLIVSIILCFVPFVYLVTVYDAMPPMDAIIIGTIGVWSVFGIVYFVEPLSFFPTLGTAGTYMSFLAGTIGQMRVPAARVAKDVAGVEDGTHEAELVAICGIAGSIYLSVGMVTLTAVAGTFILAILPETILTAISNYVLAAIFGAVLAMFAKGRLNVAIPAFAFALAFNLIITNFPVPVIVTRFNMLINVIAAIVIARIMYSKGLAK